MQTFSTIALLAASLLVKDVLASPILMDRDVIVENVVVTQEIVVTKYPNGELKTGTPKNVGTQTIVDTPVVQTSVRPVSTFEEPTSTPTPEPTPEPSPVSTSEAAPVVASSSPALFIELPATTSVAKVEQVSAAPVATAVKVEEPAPAPTTLATIVSSSAAPVASSAPSTSTRGKRGIAYNNADYLQDFVGTSASWCYNWGGSSFGANIPSQFEFVPTLWGVGSHADNWNSFADKAIASGSTHLFSFNEPDHAEQANISPSVAADGFKQYMQPYAGKAKLGAPSVTNGGGQMGLTYLGNFLNACSGCTIDFINIHWYNGGDASAFKTHVQNAYEVGGKRPVWITEFQAPGSTSEQVAFLAEVLPWLDSQSFVERYSLFMASEGLMISGGGLSEVGKAFVA